MLDKFSKRGETFARQNKRRKQGQQIERKARSHHCDLLDFVEEVQERVTFQTSPFHFSLRNPRVVHLSPVQMLPAFPQPRPVGSSAHKKCEHLVNEAEDLASNVLATSLLVVHDTSRGGLRE